MKKIVIILGIVVGVVFFLPFIGNSVVQKSIQHRLDVLSSYGIKFELLQKEHNYLDTTLSYRFFIEDKKKFLLYLQQFSKSQLPPYVNGILDGAVIGTRINYSNFPFHDIVSLEIYPLELPKKIQNNLEHHFPILLRSLQQFIQKKDLVYFIDYSVIKGEFDWRLKDIQYSFHIDKDHTLDLHTHNVYGKAKGIIVAAEKFSLKAKSIQVDYFSKNNQIVSDLYNLSYDAIFQSKEKISTNTSLAMFRLEIDKKKEYMIKNLEQKMVIDTTKDLNINEHLNIAMASLVVLDTYQAKIKNITAQYLFSTSAKEAFFHLIKQENIPKNLQQLSLKGFEFDLDKLVFEDVMLLKQHLGGCDLDAKILKQPSKNIIEKLLANINLSINKKLYNFIKVFYNNPRIDRYKKENNENIIFHLQLKDKTFFLNGHQL